MRTRRLSELALSRGGRHVAAGMQHFPGFPASIPTRLSEVEDFARKPGSNLQ